jgi:predicted ribonuclease YlaK
VALLATKAVLAVLLLPLVVPIAPVAALAGAEGALLPRAVALELLLDGDVKEIVSLVGSEGRGCTVLALW